MRIMNEALVKNWPILASIVIVASAWGVNVNRIANAEGAITEQSVRVAAVEDDIDDIAKATTINTTNQGHIVDDISEIKLSLKAILDELRED